jgi:tetratricopeptide (TPR) repeat protein
LARLYLLQEKFDQAEVWARKIVDSGQADEGARQMLQVAREKKVSEALRRQISSPAPATPATEAVARGWQLMNTGKSAEARQIFEAEVRKNPEDANAHNGLGWCLLNSGQPQEAKPQFQKAIELDPNAAGAMNGLARIYKLEGNTAEAIKLWQQMIEKFPGPHAGTYGLADTYLERGEYAKALPLLEQLAEANPNDAQIKAKLERARAGAK